MMDEEVYLNPNIGFIGDTALDLGLWDMIYPNTHFRDLSTKSITYDSSADTIDFAESLRRLLQNGED